MQHNTIDWRKTMEAGSSPKVDRRVRRTEQAIFDAVCSLVEEQHTLKITVSAVAERANINRKTFYAHYETIEDAIQMVVDKELEQLWDDILEASTDTLARSGLRFATRRIFALLNASGLVQSTLVHDGTLLHLLEYSKRPLKRIVVESGIITAVSDVANIDLYISLYLSNVIVAYYEWLNSDKTTSLDALAGMVADYTVHGTGQYLGM